MRCGFQGLVLLVHETLKASDNAKFRLDLHAGHLLVFRGKRGEADWPGSVPVLKRLERGRFIWPMPIEGAVPISPAQLRYMLEGIDWLLRKLTRPRSRGEVWPPRLCWWLLTCSSSR